jgi:two-component system response regulator NreC
MPATAIRILCVDDHSFLIDGLRARFELEPDLECVGALPDAERLLPEVARLRPHVVLLDIEMPGPDPFDAAAEVKRLHPETRVIFLSAYVRDHYLSSAVKAGAWGYFSKSDDADSIVEGIRKAHGGHFALGPKVKERSQVGPAPRRGQPAPPKSRLDALTPREQEVLRMIGRGMTRAQIAEALCRSAKTVDGHRESIMTKLDIHDRAELVRFAIREGLAEV